MLTGCDPLCLVPVAGALRLAQMGHEVDWSPRHVARGLDYDNTTFLLNDVIMADGLLFAYSAYFLSDNPIRFQVSRVNLPSST